MQPCHVSKIGLYLILILFGPCSLFCKFNHTFNLISPMSVFLKICHRVIIKIDLRMVTFCIESDTCVKSSIHERCIKQILDSSCIMQWHLSCKQSHLQNKLYIAWNMFNLTILDMKIFQRTLSRIQLQRDFWLFYGCSLRLLHDRQVNSYQRYLSHRYRLSAF